MSRNLKDKTDFKSILHKNLYLLLKDNVVVWAKKINVSESTIRDGWFKMESYPGADKIMKICKEAKVSADWLLWGKKENDEIVELKQEIDELKVEKKCLHSKIREMKKEKKRPILKKRSYDKKKSSG